MNVEYYDSSGMHLALTNTRSEHHGVIGCTWVKSGTAASLNYKQVYKFVPAAHLWSPIMYLGADCDHTPLGKVDPYNKEKPEDRLFVVGNSAVWAVYANYNQPLYKWFKLDTLMVWEVAND